MIDCIIVDDTPLAVEKLEDFVNQTPSLNLLQSFNNGLEALNYLHSHKVDLVFLDIQMEQFTGLQLMEALHYRPQIIIVSAYSQYAVQGFDNNVTDYLLKPYSFERFLKAIDKMIVVSSDKVVKDYMFVKTEYRMERINFSDILYIEGMGAYLQIVTKQAKVMTLLNFMQIMQLLPIANFIRVHKSFIVAIDKIDSIERNVIRIGGKMISVGKSYQDEFYKRI
ncbi:MAG: LytTR family DNA-binding domain-containing protein [Prevotella sp.]|jgi:DNA-binding LytR/AlgR family response regulator|nr:LytTR family DNA-binding domain-containing protein [Prevotella sp.]